MHKLGKSSGRKLSTCHPDLQLIVIESIKVSTIDFGVAQGERTVEQQQQYFNDGKSKINPKAYDSLKELLSKAKHIVDGEIRILSDAVDLYAYVNNSANWEVKNLCFIGGVITSTAKRLLSEGRISHELRWGGNWDMDGEIITDQNFQDLPHFELIKIN